MSFYERYETVCLSRGIDPCSQKAAEMLGTTRSNISYWKKGTKPSIDRLRDAANMLQTSADYLIGRTDDPTDYTLAGPVQADELRSITEMLVRLDENDRIRAAAYIQGLLDGDKYSL